MNAVSFMQRAIPRLSRDLWQVGLPALLSLSCLRFLVPTPAAAKGTWAAALAAAGESAGAAMGLALFVGFTLVARYWGGFLDDPAKTKGRETRRVTGALAAAALAAALAMGLRSTVGTYRVAGTSMLPTLGPDDLVGGYKLGVAGRSPERGDLVVFRNPNEGSGLVVKRVFGLAGDRIEMNGMQPVINGWKVPHCDVGGYFYPLSEGGGVAARLHVEFLEGRAHLALYAPARPFTGAYVVKPGEVFVLGDNRVNSVDSRSWNDGQGGSLPIDRIEARVRSWLAGMRRDGHLDFSRFLRPFELEPLVPGVAVDRMRDGIRRCLDGAPAKTTPPQSTER